MASTKLRSEALTPMPRARVIRAAAVKPGVLASSLAPNRASSHSLRIVPGLAARGVPRPRFPLAHWPAKTYALGGWRSGARLRDWLCDCGQVSAFGFQLSAFSFQLSAFSFQLPFV